MNTITLTVDGRQVTTEAGSTVLQAARDAGIEIPTICAHEDLPDYGACRMCVVEIEGVRGHPTSCTTPAAEGMVVTTQSPELQRLRDDVMELMLSGHPNACLVCNDREACDAFRPKSTKAGRSTRCGFCSNKDGCMVRDMNASCQPQSLNLPTLYCDFNLERDDPFMERDLNMCILCGRCWRICEKIHGTPALSITRRGRWAKVGAAFGKSFVDSGCTFCGACIDICPTGTLTDRYARWYGGGTYGWDTACTLCPEGCSMKAMISDGRLTSMRMTGFDRDARLCALGRFAYPQIMYSTRRLDRPMIEENGELIYVDWEEALGFVGEKLNDGKGDGFVAIVSESNTRENRYMYERFATDVMGGRIAYVPADGGFDDISDESVKNDLRDGKINTAIVGGAFIDAEMAGKIDFLVIMDFQPSPAADSAQAILPVAVLAEIEGTFRSAAGEVKELGKAVKSRGESRPEWMVLRDLAGAMNAEGLAFDDVKAISGAIDGDAAPATLDAAPRDVLKEVASRFRGHFIADSVPCLERVGLPKSPEPPASKLTGGFLITEKEEVVPNFHLFTVEAPAIAKFAKPGQFVIVMVSETSERVPFTLVDWDAEAGTIQLVVEEVGRSSGEIATLKKGDFIAHVTGPLGLPLEIEKVGTVALGGGCYGLGAIYPLARAYKEAGNKVVCVMEGCSAFTLYYEDQLRSVADELLVVTKDGGRGMKGGIQDAFLKMLDDGGKVDQFVAIGCTFMMKLVSDRTRDRGVPLQVALNPIMVDGTGMCGACRISIAGETKFACVDGPFFDGHDVDWEELRSRRSAYRYEEIEAIPQAPAGGRMTDKPATLTKEGCALPA
jgi:NAD(P)H-flavin reductase